MKIDNPSDFIYFDNKLTVNQSQKTYFFITISQIMSETKTVCITYAHSDGCYGPHFFTFAWMEKNNYIDLVKAIINLKDMRNGEIRIEANFESMYHPLLKLVMNPPQDSSSNPPYTNVASIKFYDE